MTLSTPGGKKVFDDLQQKKEAQIVRIVGMKTGRVHILVHKRPATDKEANIMCDTPQTKETAVHDITRERDVDDLIFRDEKEWQSSDR